MDNDSSVDVDEKSRRKRFTMFQKHEVSRNNVPEYNVEVFNDDFPIIDCKEEEFDEPELKKQKPQRGRPKKKTESVEWTDEATEALIELWQTKGELFNKAHPQFYARDMKDKAVEDIKEGLQGRGYNVSVNQILSKFQSLRTYFCSQRTKLTQSIKSGNSHDECKWRFFKSLHFLDDNMKPRENYNTVKRQQYNNDHSSPYMRSMVVKEDPNPVHDFHEFPFAANYETTTPNFKAETYSHDPKSTNVDSKNDDQLFGELVGNMIHQLPVGQQKDLLKLDIQQMIIKAKYSTEGSSPSTA